METMIACIIIVLIPIIVVVLLAFMMAAAEAGLLARFDKGFDKLVEFFYDHMTGKEE